MPWRAQALTGQAGLATAARRLSHDGTSDQIEARNDADTLGGITRGVGDTFGVAALVLGAPRRQYGMRVTERSPTVDFSTARSTRILLYFVISAHMLCCLFWFSANTPAADHFATAP